MRGWLVFDPGTFWHPDDIFFIRRVKIWKFGFLRVNFPNPEVTDLTQPNPSYKKMTQPNPGQKILTRTHHYFKSIMIFARIFLFQSIKIFWLSIAFIYDFFIISFVKKFLFWVFPIGLKSFHSFKVLQKFLMLKNPSNRLGLRSKRANLMFAFVTNK